MSGTPPAAAGGDKEVKKRRREPRGKGKAATKKAGKDVADRVEPQEEDIVWEAVVVPQASDSGEDNEDEVDPLEIADILASDAGVPPRPSGPMIRSGTVKTPSDVEDDSDDIDAPQDGTIKRLVQSVRNRKRQTGRGHQLPPEERAREKELEARRKEKADKKRQRKEGVEKNAAGGDAAGGANISADGKDAVIEIDMKEHKPLKESRASDGPKKKTLRMSKAEKEIYRNAHRTLLLAYIAHLLQLSKAANCDELHAMLLSMLPASEWPRRDSQGVVHADVPLLLSLCRWVRATFATAEPATATAPMDITVVKKEVKDEKEEKALFTPVKKRKAPKKEANKKEETKTTPRKKEKGNVKPEIDSDASPDKKKKDEKKRAAGSAQKKRKSKKEDESDFERESDGEDEDDADEEELVEEKEEKPLIEEEGKGKKKKTTPKAAATPLKTQAEAVNVATLPAWSVDWWTQRLLAVTRRERTATPKEQQVLLVCALRALGIDARCVCSVPATPLAKTKDFSLTPEKDHEAAGKPYPAHGNDLALDMCWTEVYSPQLHRWVPVDASQSIVNKPLYPESLLNTGARRGFTSLAYVLSVDRRDASRDVTRRYAKSFASVASALRTDRDWWNRTLQSLSPVPDTEAAERDRDEEEELAEKEAEAGEFPTSKELYRKHPLYVLEKFVGKFDIIYPMEKPLGYCGKEAIWPRSAVHHLHTQDGWLKEGREVRLGEAPMKRVPKRQRKKKDGEELKPLDTELFGLWQTEKYQRPVAIDGIVPKNEHGNVYMYQKWMLPIGCVQVNLPQIARTCRYLKVDYAQALVAWEPRGGFNCPVFEGVIICEEFYDAVREAWEEHYNRRIAKEAQEQRNKAIARWRKFAMSLLVRNRLKRTYAAQETGVKHGNEEVEVPVRQLPTAANKARHIHSFGAGTQDASGKWSKACSCGYSVEYEEI